MNIPDLRQRNLLGPETYVPLSSYPHETAIRYRHGPYR